MSEQPYDGMEIYTDDGEVAGHAYSTDDGDWVMVRNGVPVAAFDADGNELDHTGFEVNDAFDDDPLAEAHERLDELEQRMSEPPPTLDYELPEAREQQWATGVMRELSNFEQMIGRSLTDAEAHRILGDTKADFDAGVGMSVLKSAEAAGLNSFTPGRGAEDESSAARHENRSAYMTELLEDQARAQAGRVYGDAPERMAEEYDRNPDVGDRGHSTRVQLAMDTINGHDTEGRTYDSSQTYYEED